MATVTAQHGYALNWGPNGEAAPELSGEWIEIIRLTDTAFEARLASGFVELYTGRGFRSDNPIVTNYKAFKPDGSLALIASAPEGVPADEAVNDFSFFELSGPDTIHGANLGDTVYGLGGGDAMFGHAGADLLDGGRGGDSIDGGGGDDRLIGGPGNDRLDGGPGGDLAVFTGPRAAYAIANNPDGLEVTHLGKGPDGTDSLVDVEWLDFSDGRIRVEDIPPDPLSGTPGPDTLTGTAAGETMRGFGGADVMAGLGGDDELVGGGGNDRLDGGAGDDRLVGGKGDDVLLGRAGGDRLLGQGGDDLLIGHGGFDILEGAAGRDELRGGLGADELSGGNNGDLLDGGDGPDTLLGNRGPDTLVGSVGDDVLTGGLGADTFVFTGLSDGVDRVTDLDEAGGDRIDVSQVLEGFVPGVSDVAEFIRLTDDGQDTTLGLDADGGGDGFADLIVIEGVVAVTPQALIVAADPVTA